MNNKTIGNLPKYDLICMGRVGVDLYAEQIYSPLKDVQSFRKYLGGSPANICVGAARLGLNTALLSGVGCDEMGKFLKQTLEKEGVDVSFVYEFPNYLTALVLLGIDPPHNFPLIFYRNTCADMQINNEHVSEDMFLQTKMFLFSGTGISTESMREATKQALKYAQKNNVTIILDVDYRPVLWGLTNTGDGETRYIENLKVSECYSYFLPYCNIIVGTTEELCIASGETTIDSAITKIQSISKADIIHKNGMKGSQAYLCESKKIIQRQTFPVKVLNTLGAGDAYMAGFMSALVNGEGIEAALSKGNACGAMVSARHGCAPAMPNIKELDFFMIHYENEKAGIMSNFKLNKLHKLTVFKKREKKSLAILAYDHRWQFEKSCEELKVNFEKICSFKKLVYQGYKKVSESYGGCNRLGVICDKKYALEAVQNETQNEMFLCVPIEASGIHKITWLQPATAYEILVERPSVWGVKVLWRYHSQMDRSTKEHQFRHLHELHKACEKLERKLMLELIIPDEYTLNGTSLSNAMRDVYKEDIFPYWWKLQSLKTPEEWEQIDHTLTEFDDSAQIIVLGGPTKKIHEYKHEFKVMKRSPYVNGFAVGRSIFWPVWIDYANKKITDEQVINSIHNNYKQMIELWENPDVIH